MSSPTVAGLSDNAKLLGTDKKSEAEVEQWISFGDEELFNQVSALLQFYWNRIPYNKVVRAERPTTILVSELQLTR